MAMRRRRDDNFKRAANGLWLPRRGLRIPRDPLRSSSKRYLPGYPCPPCCPEGGECPCSHCAGSAPNNARCCLLVAISVANDVCLNCGDVSGSYDVDWVGEAGDVCLWEGHVCEGTGEESPPCGFLKLKVVLYEESGTGPEAGYHLKVTLDGIGDDAIVWDKNLGADKPNCLTWSNVSVPYDSAVGDCCDGSANAATVTAYPATHVCDPGDPCGEVECDYCKCFEFPEQYQVILDGIQIIGNCQECGDLNATYILNAADPVQTNSFCNWKYEVPSPPGSCCLVSVDLRVYSGRVDVLVWNCHEDYEDCPYSRLAARFREYYGSGVPCSAFDGEDIAFDDDWSEHSGILCNPHCDWSAATCTVSAL